MIKSAKASILTSILIMITLTFPAMIQGIFKLSPIGLFILKIDPVQDAIDYLLYLRDMMEECGIDVPKFANEAAFYGEKASIRAPIIPIFPACGWGNMAV